MFFYYYFKISFKRYNASSLIKQKNNCNSIEAYYDKTLIITLLIGKESFLKYYISLQRSQLSHQLVLKYQNSEMQVVVIQFLVLIGVIQSRVLFGVIRFLVLVVAIQSRVLIGVIRSWVLIGVIRFLVLFGVIQFLVLFGVIRFLVLFGVIQFLVLVGVIRSRVAED